MELNQVHEETLKSILSSLQVLEQAAQEEVYKWQEAKWKYEQAVDEYDRAVSALKSNRDNWVWKKVKASLGTPTHQYVFKYQSKDVVGRWGMRSEYEIPDLPTFRPEDFGHDETALYLAIVFRNQMYNAQHPIKEALGLEDN
jgi:hypothetical protein